MSLEEPLLWEMEAETKTKLHSEHILAHCCAEVLCLGAGDLYSW